MLGMSAEDADAASAYTQADLGGPPTWITLPRDRWPRELFGKYDNPVVCLRQALSGDPFGGFALGTTLTWRPDSNRMAGSAWLGVLV
eukprot:8075245-Karenia_brevis.AAC.1